MLYIISFLEGVITFISPCLLPMLPIYITYFAGEDSKKSSIVKNSLAFIMGFTVVFVSLGIFAGTLGGLLIEYNKTINIISGIVIILLGLNFMEIIHIKILNTTKRMEYKESKKGVAKAFLFGIVFSIGWTPCVGAFLGSVLAMVSQKGQIQEGFFALLFYSLGLGLPFLLSAILIDSLKKTFDFIKRNYKIINRISGGILIFIGILMATGQIGYLYRLISF